MVDCDSGPESESVKFYRLQLQLRLWPKRSTPTYSNSGLDSDSAALLRTTPRKPKTQERLPINGSEGLVCSFPQMTMGARLLGRQSLKGAYRGIVVACVHDCAVALRVWCYSTKVSNRQNNARPLAYLLSEINAQLSFVGT